MTEAWPGSRPAARCRSSFAASGGRHRKRSRLASPLHPASWTSRLAHTMLRRSLVELHAGDYRLCVIDACSAAEIALNAATTARLPAHRLAAAAKETLVPLGSGSRA